MRPEQQTIIQENPHVHILDLVLFCPKAYFIIVKKENKVYQVNLCIFLPHLHKSLFKIELRLFSYEINHFNMTFMQIKTNSNLNILNMDESCIL